MQESIKVALGVLIVLLGIPIGNYLARITKEELKDGRRFFKLIAIFSLAGAIISLIIGNDALLFTFSFIAVVTSRSLKNKKK